MERRQVTAAGKAPPRQQLPPGFRFHPTDEELVVQYLRRKALARPLPAAVIPVVHVAALPDPWDLPGASEGEAAYFFNLRQAPPRRRRTASGYWKATGKEKPVFVQLQGPSGSGSGKRLLVGVKTALAFHRGKGKASLTRTDWVMHEYRLAAAPGDSQQSCEWVVCRVSLKNNRARRPSAADAGSETTAAVHREREDGAGGDHHRPSSPSSSCVTDTCHASDHHEEISSSSSQ
uniref:Uncharacterized protein n=2 Tax=Avena sativa TaxID=4498 RepID=A0ACD5XUD8_AVESA